MIKAQPDPSRMESHGSESIEDLFEALESPLLGYAFRLVNEPGLAEDLVQEAFMKLHAQFAQVREPKKWLYRTVHNLSANHHRRARRIVPIEPASEETPQIELIDPTPLPGEAMTRSEGIKLVRVSLDNLDDRSREVVRLKFDEELSYQEIGRRTGLSSGHVGYLLHHALKEIAAELSKTGVVP